MKPKKLLLRSLSTCLFISAVLLLSGNSFASSIGEQPPQKAFSFAACGGINQYPAAKAAGFDYIEPGVSDFLVPDKPFEEFKTRLDEKKRSGAKIISCTSFIPGHLKAVGGETKHPEIRVWADTVFSRAQMAEIPIIVFGSGSARFIPEGFDKQKATEQFISLCKQLGPMAQAKGVTLVIEPLNSRETNLINSLQEGAAIVEAVNHPNIQLLSDFYHMMMDNEPAGEIVKYGKYIRHCHIAEKENRAAPGVNGEDFTPFLEALKKVGYQGCISVECNWKDREKEYPVARTYLEEQFEK